MSVKLMSEVWECAFEHSEQAVMLAMADHAKDDGTKVFPSIGHIAWKTGYSARQVSRIVGSLLQAGCLILVSESRQHRPNEYRIDLVKVTRKEPFRESEKPVSRHVKMSSLENPSQDKVSSLESPDLTSATSRQDIAVSSESSIEPSVKPSPPSEEVSKDSRYQPFVEAFYKFYEYLTGEKHGWGKSHGQQLNRFLKENPKLTVDDFRAWLNYYRQSENINPAAKAREVLPKLHRYRLGALDRFGNPKQSRLQVVEAQETALDRHRRQLQGDYSQKGTR